MGSGTLKTAATGGFSGGGKEGLVTTLSGGSNQLWAKAKGGSASSTDPFGLTSHGEGESPEQMAARLEAEKQARIKGSIDSINNVYDSPERQKQYNDFINAVRSKNNQDLGRQQTIANLQTKFATARNGLTGGSRDVDAQHTLGQEYQQGVLGSEAKAQGALADLKGQDNNARLQLIQLAQSGLDATTAASRAEAGTQADAAKTLASATANGLGDIFANTTSSYQANQQAAALRAGRTAPLGSLYGKPGF